MANDNSPEEKQRSCYNCANSFICRAEQASREQLTAKVNGFFDHSWHEKLANLMGENCRYYQ